MNKETHRTFGMLIWDQLPRSNQVLCSRPAFLWGCVAPDFSPLLLLRPHTPKRRLEQVQERVFKLFGTLDKRGVAGIGKMRLARHLGVLCHFYADFFCLAHNGRYPHVRQHLQYEKELCQFMRSQMGRLKMIRLQLDEAPMHAAVLAQNLEDERRFHLSQPAHLSEEVYAALQGCFTMANSILCYAAKQAERGTPRLFPSVDFVYSGIPSETGLAN